MNEVFAVVFLNAASTKHNSIPVTQLTSSLDWDLLVTSDNHFTRRFAKDFVHGDESLKAQATPKLFFAMVIYTISVPRSSLNHRKYSKNSELLKENIWESLFLLTL